MKRPFPPSYLPRLSLLALAFLLAGCGQYGRLSEEEKTTSVALGSIANGRPRFATPGVLSGGVMIWGVSEKQKVAILLANETEVSEKVLKNGDWVFHAIGWNGGSQLAGTPSCGSTNKKLVGADTTVEINLTATGCADAFFAGSNTGLKRVRLASCTGILSAPDADATCDGALRGDFQSFRLRLNSYEPTSTEDMPSPGPSLLSSCVNTGASSYASALEFIPAGLAGSSAIAASVEGFTAASCGGNRTEFSFPQGLRNLARNGGAIFKPDSTFFGGYHSLYLIHGIPAPPTLSAPVPAMGSWGGNTLISLSGTNFDANSTVTIGGMNCPVDSHTPTLLKCYTPRPGLLVPGASFPVVVKRGYDNVSTPPQSFTYVEEGFGDGGLADTLSAEVTLIPPIMADAPLAALASRSLHSYRNVSAMNADKKTLTLRSSITAAEFAPNDDVLWHVSAASSITACDSGGVLTPGSFGFSKVSSASGTQLVLRSPLPVVADAAKLLNSNRSLGSDFCLIQVVRFPAFKNLTIDTNASVSGTFIAAPAFNMATGSGGILIVKAHDLLTIRGPSDVFFQSAGGFAGGVASPVAALPGESVRGTPIIPGTSKQSGGGGGSSSSTGGGGGGSSVAAGGSGAMAGSSGALSMDSSCDPGGTHPCALFGGGGGGGALAGASGGGIVLVYARGIENGSGSSNKIFISADGSPGALDKMGGGGAGTALAQVATIGNPGVRPILFAQGGYGGWVSTGTSPYGGGGGAGGAISTVNCASNGLDGQSRFLTPGAGASNTYPGSIGGAGYRFGHSYTSGQVPWCP